MDALPEFRVLNPATLDEAIAARAEHPDSKPLGGGTDLVVNIRRGIVAPPVLIDMNRVEGLHAIHADENTIEIGASVTLTALAEHPVVVKYYPVLAQAAGFIAGPTHRNMGTVGGNLCLDTRCIFYNQSEWWRTANMLDYRVPTIQDSPPIEVGIVESNDPHGPFGAKEAGEGSLAAFLPALTNAIADAIGIRFNDLPVTPDRVFEAIEKRRRKDNGGGA